jgi:hypothetical protein
MNPNVDEGFASVSVTLWIPRTADAASTPHGVH